MRLNWLLFMAGSLAIFGLSACEEDFDSNSEYKETAVIYCLLNSSEPVQYAKVNKAFLNTKSNALFIAANNPDSSDFYHDIKVELQKLNHTDSTVLQSYQMHPETITDKEPGNFYYPNQKIYATQPNQVPLQGNDLYRILVTNLATGATYSAATRVIGPFCANQVGYNTLPACGMPIQPQDLVPYAQMRTIFPPVQNAEIYRAVYYINYQEFHPANPDGELKTIEFLSINNDRAMPFELQQNSINRVIEPYRIFEHMERVIDTSQDDPDTYREMRPSRVVITAGGKELNRYVQVNNAYSAITQSRPEYTNIRGGTGLFSARRFQEFQTFFTSRAQDTLRIKYPELKFRN